MSKKNDEDVYRAISKILNVDTSVLKKSKKLSKIKEWDSLNHLNILVKLDKMFHNKASSIVEMGKADSINKILKLLREHNLIT